MAQDIHAIPITTMALEFTLSSNGRVIDSQHASLSTKIVQILLCGSD